MSSFIKLQSRVKEVMVLDAIGVLTGKAILELASTYNNGSNEQRLQQAISQTRQEAMNFVAHIINVE